MRAPPRTRGIQGQARGGAIETCPNRSKGTGGGLGLAPLNSKAAEAGRAPQGPGTIQTRMRAPPHARGRPGWARGGAIEAYPNHCEGAGGGLEPAPLTSKAAQAGRGPNGPGTNETGMLAPPCAQGRPGRALGGAIMACPNHSEGAGGCLGPAPLTTWAAEAGRGPHCPGTNQTGRLAPPHVRVRPGRALGGALEACPNRGEGAGGCLGLAPLTS